MTTTRERVFERQLEVGLEQLFENDAMLEREFSHDPRPAHRRAWLAAALILLSASVLIAIWARTTLTEDDAAEVGARIVTPELDRTPDPRTTAELVSALRGVKFAPYAVRELARRDAGAARAVADLLERTDPTKHSICTSQCLSVLRRMPDRAGSAFEVLQRLVRTWPATHAAELISVAAEIVPWVTSRSRRLDWPSPSSSPNSSPNSDVQKLTQQAIDRFSGRAKVRADMQLSELTELLASPNIHTRAAAIDVLAVRESIDETAARTLASIVFGEPSRAITPALRGRAAYVLSRTESTRAFGAVGWAYRLRHSERVAEASRAAAMIGPILAEHTLSNREFLDEVITALVEAAIGKDPGIGGHAIESLRLAGQQARAAIPVLEELSTRQNRHISDRAKAALERVR